MPLKCNYPLVLNFPLHDVWGHLWAPGKAFFSISTQSIPLVVEVHLSCSPSSQLYHALPFGPINICGGEERRKHGWLDGCRCHRDRFGMVEGSGVSFGQLGLEVPVDMVSL